MQRKGSSSSNALAHVWGEKAFERYEILWPFLQEAVPFSAITRKLTGVA